MASSRRPPMASSITERLNRDEWNPQPGDTVEGTIVSITARSIVTKEDHRTVWFPVVTIDPGDGQPGVIVDCGRGGLADPVIAARPKKGERIGFRFIGPVDNPKTGKTWNKYVVEFEAEPPEPDWDLMVGSRNGQPGYAPRDVPPDDTPDIPPDEPPDHDEPPF